ncbi:UNVERIFIED_CONTAM: hypothetical protein RMT77_012894 [Armadillidium vulgare]
MANFNEEGLKKKFLDLNMSQQSIQTLSLWLIHHKKHAHNIVNAWFKELVKAPESRKLAFMYLANDVIQNSKKKGPEYNKEFNHRLPKAFKHLGGITLAEKHTNGVKRLLNVWEERGVFHAQTIKDFRRRFEHQKSHHGRKHSSGADSESSKRKKSRRESLESFEIPNEDEFPSALESHSTAPSTTPLEDTSEPKPIESTVEPRQPPEPEELIQSLQDLENAATADAEVRKNIANLPPAVSDLNGLGKLPDLPAGEALEKNVDDALEMINTYNKRLSDEMEARKSVAKLLHDFISHQKDHLSQTEETLEEHRSKLNKVQKVRQELKAHLQNLPDISKLPNLGGGLAPLPSAGDLFT